MACDLPTTQAAACESGIGKIDNSVSLLQIIAQLSCEIADAGGGAATTPGLPLNSVQFNNAGAFGGSADLTFNDATNVLAVVGDVNSTRFLAGNGAVGTPSYSFASDTTTGIYRVGAFRIGFVTGGVLRFEANNSLLELKAGTSLSFNSATALFSDAATTIDQRNGVTAQSFKVYRTWTNAANYERISLGSAAGQMIVAAETAGTGGDDLDLTLTPTGTGRVRYGAFVAAAGETFAGTIEIKDAGGTLRKLAVFA